MYIHRKIFCGGGGGGVPGFNFLREETSEPLLFTIILNLILDIKFD